MRRICRYLPLISLLFLCFHLANAQSSFELNLGFGAVQDKSTGSGIEGDYSGVNSINFAGSCAIGSTPTCVPTKSLSGLTMGMGGALMLWKHLGVGVDVNFQPGKHDYGVFPAISSGGQLIQPVSKAQIRTIFYDFDGIYAPLSAKKYAVHLIGGIGGANVKSYLNQSASASPLGSSNSSQLLVSSNHFQIHGGAAVEIFVTDHVFLRPQFDIHYVPNFTQFGRNLATSEMIWLGYSFGDR